MKRYVFIPLSLVLILFSGCDMLGLDDDADAVYLRVANKSNTDFSSVLVAFPGGVKSSYSSISAGQTSEYHKLDAVYHYGYAKIKAEGNMYAMQIYDVVGEEPLGNGHYTYNLDIVDGKLRGEIVQE